MNDAGKAEGGVDLRGMGMASREEKMIGRGDWLNWRRGAKGRWLLREFFSFTLEIFAISYTLLEIALYVIIHIISTSLIYDKLLSRLPIYHHFYHHYILES